MPLDLSWQECTPAKQTRCRADRGAGTQDRTAGDGTRFFKKSVAAFQGATSASRRQWRGQLYQQIRLEIISGALSAGARLPSTRDLTGQLGVSRNTIVYAFDRLVAEGYLEGRRGSGIYVAELQLTATAQIGESQKQSPGLPLRSARLSALSSVSISPSYPGAKIRPFRPCQPAVDWFPLRNWNRARSYALRSPAGEVLCEVDAGGLPRLRRALAVYLRDSRGVHCEVEQIVITAGTQEALSLIAELLIAYPTPLFLRS